MRFATPEDAPAISRIKIAAWREAYAHILDREVLDGLDSEVDTSRWLERISNFTDKEQCWVACDGAQVVGYIVMGPNRFPEAPCDGELQAIYVDPSQQRRGIGRLLLRPAVDWMIEKGFESMAVFVFRDNPKGTGFYKSTGAEFLDTGNLEIGGKQYVDESYIWKSLVELQKTLAR